jgi:plasmid stability protein
VVLVEMKNVTITLDERTAAWVRVYAAKHNTSVSRMVGEMLQQRMKESREYDEAMRRFLAKKPVRLKRPGAQYATRDELHDRPRLR